MSRAWLFVLVACAHSAPQPQPAPAQPARVPRVSMPDVVFVADLNERRVGNDYAAFGGSARPVGVLPITARRFATEPRPSSFTAIVDYCVDPTGHVISARASASDPGLEPLAVDTVRSWQFAPYFVDDKPVTACSTVSLKTADLRAPHPVAIGVRRIELP